MRAYEKKKKYKDHCRSQVKSWYINNADGHWIPYRDSGTYANMHRDQKAGYKL